MKKSKRKLNFWHSRNRSTPDFARKNSTLSSRNRSGQLEISFGMIFSIILIIVFLSFGFYAIKKFLDLQSSVQIEKFASDFQDDVTKMWKGSQGSEQVSYTLPTKISSICFTDGEFENLKFSSNSVISGKMIEHIDISKITKNGNYCIQNIKGKVSMTISKDYKDTLVTIK